METEVVATAHIGSEKKTVPLETLVVNATGVGLCTARGSDVGPRASTVAVRHEPARSGLGTMALNTSCVGSWKTTSDWFAGMSGSEVAVSV